LVLAQSQLNSTKKPKRASCSNDDTGLKLPAGFCATVFADGIGHARHLAVGPNGVVYQKDLGPDTLKRFESMDRYNPDKTWKPTADEWPADAASTD